MLQRLLIVAVFLISSSPSIASMIIDRAIVVYEPGQPSRQDVQISNPDKEPLFVKVTIFEVQNPGTEQEKRVEVKNPKDIPFLVTPNKLVVPPNGNKLVRLVNLAKGGDTDRIYRINLTPVVGEVESTEMALKVVVGYQLLVMVQPEHPNATLEVTRKGRMINFKNVGNTNVLVRNGKQCPAGDSNEVDCREINGTRIYAGNSWTSELPFDQPVNFSLTIGSKNKKVSYP